MIQAMRQIPITAESIEAVHLVITGTDNLKYPDRMRIANLFHRYTRVTRYCPVVCLGLPGYIYNPVTRYDHDMTVGKLILKLHNRMLTDVGPQSIVKIQESLTRCGF